MQKKTVISVIVVAILLAISLYFIGSTYARYISDFSGEAKATAAAWKVKIGEEAQKLTFSVEENENVVTDKIAPATKAVAEATLNLDGTEVSVDVVIKKGDNFEQAITDFGLDASQITFSIEDANTSGVTSGKATGKGTEDSPLVIKLADKAALAGSVKLKVTIEWADKGEAYNAEHDMNKKDTAIGSSEMAKTITLPVTLVVQQHIGA